MHIDKWEWNHEIDSNVHAVHNDSISSWGRAMESAKKRIKRKLLLVICVTQLISSSPKNKKKLTSFRKYDQTMSMIGAGIAEPLEIACRDQA